MSTIFPLPSSPHWAPMTMTLFTRFRLPSGPLSEDQVAGRGDVGKLAQLREHVLRHGVVHVDQRHRRPADLPAAELQPGDVDPLFAEERPDPADHAGDVL